MNSEVDQGRRHIYVLVSVHFAGAALEINRERQHEKKSMPPRSGDGHCELCHYIYIYISKFILVAFFVLSYHFPSCEVISWSAPGLQTESRVAAA